MSINQYLLKKEKIEQAFDDDQEKINALHEANKKSLYNAKMFSFKDVTSLCKKDKTWFYYILLGFGLGVVLTISVLHFVNDDYRTAAVKPEIPTIAGHGIPIQRPDPDFIFKKVDSVYWNKDGTIRTEINYNINNKPTIVEYKHNADSSVDITFH